MTRHRTPANCPIHHLLMLAPANFGSPLAHKGRSFVGRVVKGFKSDRRFQTGARILFGLEMASPFSWQLALQDRFGSSTWYGPGGILCTVLVGNTGYSGIAAAANESGSDGTVLVSSANLNPVLVSMDFCANPQQPVLKVTQANGITAFARINPENHGTITMNEKGGFRFDGTMDLIRRALQVDDKGFAKHVADCDALAASMREASKDDSFRQGYQNSVIRLTDSANEFVEDYFMEFFAKRADRNAEDAAMTAAIQEKVIGKVHVYEENAAYRSLKINITQLEERIGLGKRSLFVSITAMPDVRRTGSVGYSTFGWDDIGSIDLTPARRARLFAPDRTALIDVKIRREQQDKVFRFRPLPAKG
jgi:hypothetical protein